MKAKEVLKKLKITRPTLTRMVQDGRIKVEVKKSGRYDYDKESIETILKEGYKETILYVRINKKENKKNLESQINFVKILCEKNNILFDKVYKDISNYEEISDIYIDIVDRIYNNEIKEILVYNKDIINHNPLFEAICKRHNCKMTFLIEKDLKNIEKLEKLIVE